MKKILIVLLLLTGLTYTAEELQDVGLYKYAVLKTKSDRTPIRNNHNENAVRLSHVPKDTVIFADKQTQNYYRIELKEQEFAWINKKFVDVENNIQEKRFKGIKKLSFNSRKNKYEIKIITPQKSAYKITEDGDNLKFTLYDNRFDPLAVKVSNLSDKFELSKKLDDELNIYFKNDKKLFGYGIEPTEEGYILNIKKPPKLNKKKLLKGIRIVVDPGHGGCEFGAVAFGLKEKDINLEIAKILKKELRKKGAKVYITRKQDKQVPLYSRVDFAKEKQADILLSIHQNALPNPADVNKKHGVGTYYYNRESFALASSIQKRLLEATGFKDDLVNHRSFALTRPTEHLSVLIECGYLIYKPEADKLIKKDFQKRIAEAIIKGVEDCLRENY